MPRPRTHDDALRRRLLDTAGRHISSHGPDALSLRQLAQQTETTTRAIYSLFGSKSDLLEAVFDEAFERFAGYLNSVEHTDDPRWEILGLADAYRASALADPHLYPIMFGTVRHSMRPSPTAEGRAKATFDPLLRAVERAIEQGVFRQQGHRQIATGLWGLVHGLVSLELSGYVGDPDAPHDPGALFRTAVQAAVRGWSADDFPG